MEKNLEKRISKQLSYVLRHAPETIGILLDDQGWTDVDMLLEKLAISIEDLQYVVVNNAKQRFSFSSDGNRIRANQGHSVAINLGLVKKVPPAELYHGTSIKTESMIRTSGIKKMQRHHVHLSSDQETAKQVGGRHGKPIILSIDAALMSTDGIQFFLSDNGVWLTDFVDPKYIK